jgi:hypothetical protein
MIYAHLYTNRFPNVELLYPRKEAPVHVLPRDPWMYLDASVVDPVIAAEAAQWLFFGNSFELIAQSGTKVRFYEVTTTLYKCLIVLDEVQSSNTFPAYRPLW